MARPAGVPAKPEDGGAYEAYRRYRHLHRVRSREQQIAKARQYLTPLRGDYLNLVAQVSLLTTCQRGEDELLSSVFLSSRAVLSRCYFHRSEASSVARVLIAIDRAVISCG